MIPKYRVRCVAGGEDIRDITLLSCPNGHDSLLRADYRRRRLDLSPYPGIYRFLAWLPVTAPLLPSGGPVTFTCPELSRELSLRHLMISFSGYSPDHGADLITGSFKELEASPTLQRLKELGSGIPVIASAGNTGRAFAELSARCKRPVVIVVPEKAADRIRTTEPSEDIFLIAVRGDYSDAISVSTILAAIPGCVPEGGAGNIARRDGMGTVMLDAAVTFGRIPGHYFQAVGSGTGAISAWEAAQRLIGDGRYGNVLPCLHLAQNRPFIPMVSAWNERRREIFPDRDMPDAERSIAEVAADVLTNRKPPYGIRGGVYDALVATKGNMYGILNPAGRAADTLIRDTIGIDPDPAAAIATAALVEAAEHGIIGPGDDILLNLTGGGYARIREDFAPGVVPLSATVIPGGLQESLVADLKEWMKTYG